MSKAALNSSECRPWLVYCGLVWQGEARLPAAIMWLPAGTHFMLLPCTPPRRCSLHTHALQWDFDIRNPSAAATAIPCTLQ